MIARDKTATAKPDGESPNSAAEIPRARTDPDGGAGPSPFEPLLGHLAELQMLVGHYFRARTDQITARVRSVLFWVIVGLVGLMIAVAFLVTAVVLVLRGIAIGLMLLGLQAWAADLITGVVCIVVVGVALVIVSLSQKSAARRKRRDDYEHFRARYRAKFGHNLDDAGRGDV